MITWFDALLVTLLAIVTALGARRGLAGLAWGVGGLIIAFAVNMLGLSALPSALLALVLGALTGLAASRLIPDPTAQPWHLGAGLLGGLLLGGLVVATLALSFPLALQVTPAGRQAVYPSPDLNTELYDGIANSAIQNGLREVWKGNRAVRVLLIPDRAR